MTHNFPELYLLNDTFNDKTFQVGNSSLDTFRNGERIKLFDRDILLRGDINKLKLPIIWYHEHGSKLGDVLNTGSVSLYLISDKFRNILVENKITGWKTFPVIVYDKKDEEVPGYHGFSITGKSDPIDWSKSEIVTTHQNYDYLVKNTDAMRAVYPDWNPPPPIDFKRRKGLHPGLDGWDGSDMFIPKNSRYIIVTDKVYNALAKSKLTHLELENSNEYLSNPID